MNCLICGGWQYYTVAEIDGREGVVKKCANCKAIERIRPEEEQ